MGLFNFETVYSMANVAVRGLVKGHCKLLSVNCKTQSERVNTLMTYPTATEITTAKYTSIPL